MHRPGGQTALQRGHTGVTAVYGLCAFAKPVWVHSMWFVWFTSHKRLTPVHPLMVGSHGREGYWVIIMKVKSARLKRGLVLWLGDAGWSLAWIQSLWRLPPTQTLS